MKTNSVQGSFENLVQGLSAFIAVAESIGAPSESDFRRELQRYERSLLQNSKYQRHNLGDYLANLEARIRLLILPKYRRFNNWIVGVCDDFHKHISSDDREYLLGDDLKDNKQVQEMLGLKS